MVQRRHAPPNRAQHVQQLSDGCSHACPADPGRKKLVELTVSDVDKLLSLKTDGGLSPSTVRRIRAVLAQCLDQAIRWELVHRNVATLSRSPKMNRREGRTLTPEQARHLLETLQGHHNEALYALMLSTGLRRGEALGLRWNDFDRVTGVLRVSRQLKREGSRLVTTDTKTSLSRRAVNLPEPMLKTLLQHEARQASQKEQLGTVLGRLGVHLHFLNRNTHRPKKFVPRVSEGLSNRRSWRLASS